jgi:signal transduction histidine kinase
MLERQNDRLKEFTDILAHDLRNPLAVIEGNLELYRESGRESHIEKIGETTDRMARLVDDLLRVARQGEVVTDPERTLLQAVIETAWEGTAAGTNATLRSAAVPPMSADPDRLCELVENLFRNAVEHGGDDVTVRVGPLETGFFVEDDGPGIPADLQDDVFDHGFTTSSDGSGYGLSVVRTIANAHGWDVVVTDAPSGGARFEITGVDVTE